MRTIGITVEPVHTCESAEGKIRGNGAGCALELDKQMDYSP